jgi:hypothetical protein
MIDRACAGGECAAYCPLFNIGGVCPTPVELARWYHDNALVAESSSTYVN